MEEIKHLKLLYYNFYNKTFVLFRFHRKSVFRTNIFGFKAFDDSLKSEIDKL